MRPPGYATTVCPCQWCVIYRLHPDSLMTAGYWQAWLTAHYTAAEQATVAAIVALSALP